jgi:hypothetical protein
MKTATDGEWIVDIKNMTCRNSKTKIVVGLEKKGKGFTGKINYAPIELIELKQE